MNRFEKFTRSLTAEINGQYPRPWMTDMSDPSAAEVFVVGYNPATPYHASEVDYERYIDALLNRRGESCRGFYAEVTSQTPTRKNVAMFTEKLARAGVCSVLETNVVCYGTGKKADLRRPEHAGGKARGIEIFRSLVQEIRPKAIVVHGQGVAKEFSRVFRMKPPLPSPPDRPHNVVQHDMENGTRVFVIPPLALPGFRNWPRRPLPSFCHWADPYLDEVATQVAATSAA